MKLKDFSSFKHLASKQNTAEETDQIIQLINEILNTSYTSEIWIGQIIDFLNNNDEDKDYGEYYIKPDDYGTRKFTYRFISTEKDKPHPLTLNDENVQKLKRLKKLNGQPKFILFDYEEDPSLGMWDYLHQKKTLREVLQCLGMSNDLKEYLCEFCFDRIKQTQIASPQQKTDKIFNPELWKPIGIKPVNAKDPISTKHRGFVEYQAPNDRYEVRGVMPSAKNWYRDDLEEMEKKLTHKKQNNQ